MASRLPRLVGVSLVLRRLLLALVLCGWTSSASAQIAVANRASDLSGSDPVTIAFTVTASSPIFVAVILDTASSSVTSVNWNTSESFGAALTTRVDFGASLGIGVAVYALKNPTATTSNIVVDVSAGAFVAVYVIGTTGGDTTTGWRTPVTRNDGAGTGPGVTSNAVSGDLLFHVAAVFAATIAFDAGETTTSTTNNNIFASGYSGGLSTKPATGGDAVGATDQSFYAEIAVAAIPGGGGGGAPTPRLLLLGVGGPR